MMTIFRAGTSLMSALVYLFQKQDTSLLILK
jgi:hypothetical protein